MAPLPSRSWAWPSRQSRQLAVAKPPWVLLSKLTSSGRLAATWTTFSGSACCCCITRARLRLRKLLGWAHIAGAPTRVNLGVITSSPMRSERVRNGAPATPPEKQAS